MTSYKSIPGWSDSCAHSPAGEPAPPKSRLQGDTTTPYTRPLIDDSTHATSRGGNTKAPGGKLVPPKSQAKPTSGRSVGRKVS